MKIVRMTAFLLLMVLIGYRITYAKDARSEVGVILGEPTGLSGKRWIDPFRAVDGAIGWSISDKKSQLHLHADYLIHNFSLLKTKDGQASFYYGVGGKIEFEDKNKVAIRIPGGIQYLLSQLPVNIFAEIVPMLNVVPKTEFDLDVAIGVRYLFK